MPKTAKSLTSLPKVGFLESTDDAFISFTDQGCKIQVLPTYRRLSLTSTLLRPLARLRGITPLSKHPITHQVLRGNGRKTEHGPSSLTILPSGQKKRCVYLEMTRDGSTVPLDGVPGSVTQVCECEKNPERTRGSQPHCTPNQLNKTDLRGPELSCLS